MIKLQKIPKVTQSDFPTFGRCDFTVRVDFEVHCHPQTNSTWPRKEKAHLDLSSSLFRCLLSRWSVRALFLSRGDLDRCLGLRSGLAILRTTKELCVVSDGTSRPLWWISGIVHQVPNGPWQSSADQLKAFRCRLTQRSVLSWNGLKLSEFHLNVRVSLHLTSWLLFPWGGLAYFSKQLFVPLIWLPRSPKLVACFVFCCCLDMMVKFFAHLFLTTEKE